MKKIVLPLIVMVLSLMPGRLDAQPGTRCSIKGFIGPSGDKLYLFADHYLYPRITIKPEQGDRWFCSEQDAVDAGFRYVPDPHHPRPAMTIPTPRSASAEPDLPESSDAPDLDDLVLPLDPNEEPEFAPRERLPQPHAFQQMTNSLPVMIVLISALIMSLVMGVCLWVIYEKADQPGWGVLIPLYNAYLMLKVAGLPGWCVVLLFIPPLNVGVTFLIPFKVAQQFGKGLAYGLGLLVLTPLFLLHLAFSSAEYQG